MKCYSCKSSLDSIISRDQIVSRSIACLKCGTDIRVCKNCLFYDAGLHNECRETQAERVVDKGKANFCDFFRIQDNTGNSPAKNSKIKKDDFGKFFKSDRHNT